MSPVLSLHYGLLMALGTHSRDGCLWSGNRHQEKIARLCATRIREAEARANGE
jgi:hypothetical protein